MLRRCQQLWMQAPKIVRRSHAKVISGGQEAVGRAKRSGIGIGDLPTSGGGMFFRIIRPYLPPAWRYGWRYRLLQLAWIICTLGFVAKLAHVMFWTDEEVIAQQAARFSYVRDEQNNVVDISFKPLIDAGLRARARNARIVAEMQQEQEESE